MLPSPLLFVVMYLPQFVCLCQQDNSKLQTYMNFGEDVDYELEISSLNFGSDPKHILDIQFISLSTAVIEKVTKFPTTPLLLLSFPNHKL